MTTTQQNKALDKEMQRLKKEVKRSLPFKCITYVIKWHNTDYDALENWLLNDEITSFNKEDIENGFIPYLEKEENEAYLQAFKTILQIMDFLQLDFITVK